MFKQKSIQADLDNEGYSVVPKLFGEEVCEKLKNVYSNETKFRKRIVMAQHNFGRGEYKYFNYPLPDEVESLRAQCYEALYCIANHWNRTMKLAGEFPPRHRDYLKRCHNAGQLRPTPLLLKYGKDDYNCLHQDLYGEHVFPLQLAVLLSSPGADFDGGEFIMTEQRPRMQSRPLVIPLSQGDGVIFPVSHRPRQGTRGTYRVNMRHGVSRLRSGERYVLGVIFHDAT